MSITACAHTALPTTAFIAKTNKPKKILVCLLLKLKVRAGFLSSVFFRLLVFAGNAVAAEEGWTVFLLAGGCFLAIVFERLFLDHCIYGIPYAVA